VLRVRRLSEEEARELLRFAFALGCSLDDIRRVSAHLAPFLAALDEPFTLSSSSASSSASSSSLPAADPIAAPAGGPRGAFSSHKPPGGAQGS
jgi:hypothetical protein